MKKIPQIIQSQIKSDFILNLHKDKIVNKDSYLTEKQFSDLIKYSSKSDNWVTLNKYILRGDDSRWLEPGEDPLDENEEPKRTYDWDEYYFYYSWDIPLDTLDINLLPNLYADVIVKYLGSVEINFNPCKSIFFTQNGTRINQGLDLDSYFSFGQKNNKNLYLHINIFISVINPVKEDEEPLVINDFQAKPIVGYIGLPVKTASPLPSELTVVDISTQLAG